jgi:vitamin B12/bleomycin/antimicrobial peptide transport system ATP-binding/permease protein
LSGTPPLAFVFREALRIALPYFRSEERWIALALLVAAVGAQFALVGMAVATNYWRNAFFETLQQKNWPGFLYWFWIYCVIGVGFILGTVYHRYFAQWLTIRWRRWLTAHYLDRWLDGPVHYRATLTPNAVDNPDQRVAEDIRQFIDESLFLSVGTGRDLTGIGLLGVIAKLFSFVGILWSLSEAVPLRIFGDPIPGYLVWGALLYAVLGSFATHFIGRGLIKVDFEQQRREANFRFALVRLRENSEVVATLRGEAAERNNLFSRFAAIQENWFRQMRLQQFIGLFAETFRYYSLYFPYFIMAPLYFGGGMQLGAFMQTGSAFNQVRSAFSYFIESYLKIAEFAAVVQRLSQFETAITEADKANPSHFEVRRYAKSTDVIAVRNLVVTTSKNERLAVLDRLQLSAGEALLINGPSGAGKTSLLRCLGEIWPYAGGDVRTSALRSFGLPQRAYLPLGSLRDALAYPEGASTPSDDACKEVLGLVGLLELVECLDEIAAWDKRLSEGEKQRLSIARALLYKPDLLLLDEATAALDEASELHLHRIIRGALPHAAIIAVSHRLALSAIYDRTVQVNSPAQSLLPPVRAAI